VATEPVFFESPAAFRAWLEEHHETAREVTIGYHKKASGKPSMTWSESVDEALCFGWIDGVRRRLDDSRYTIRFTPRRPRSVWSAANVRRVEELEAAGRLRPAGRAAFERRSDARSGVYSYEQRDVAIFEPEAERRFRSEPEAWAFFESQPPSYRRAATHWVATAKRPETRERRLATLIADSAAGRTVPPLTRPPRR
jgi:uncharacterized protein YdeI (YjbR/CyaY-like superfamily)